MPELPEVEAARLAIQQVAAGRRIRAVWCADDPLVFEGAMPAGFRRALLGRRVRRVGRHGKHLWLELDRRPWPCLHFGMTGGVYTPRGRRVKLRSSRRTDDGARWPPRFTKLRLTFSDGGELAIADPRRLGRIRLRDDPRQELPIRALGFDALRELPPPAEFEEQLRRRAAPVKAVLLDQSFAAGVGNWVADEVLYQAGIDPRRRARSLSTAEARRLRTKLRSVLRTAVRAGAQSDRYPRTWLFHHRWDRNTTTARGEQIRHATVGGRTTAWAPAAQR
ncbi:MAG TPA: DNA-formamidopyrimidine glycosylase family protein [Methylomirabilota bacterium]|jgi:formamidopyrimidine-DNA glycosylase|nr:DNA-formamidopyrimidine glycosylase family protein [Methylomirabilota bacterium]